MSMTKPFLNPVLLKAAGFKPETYEPNEAVPQIEEVFSLTVGSISIYYSILRNANTREIEEQMVYMTIEGADASPVLPINNAEQMESLCLLLLNLKVTLH